jgi:hypothetical protein
MLLDFSPVVRHGDQLVPGCHDTQEPLMTTGTERNRVAMAMFESTQCLCQDLSEDLCGGLGDFDQAGFAGDQMGVAGVASATSALVQSTNGRTPKSAHFERLISGFKVPVMATGQAGILASAGPLWPALQCFGTAPGDPLVMARWIALRSGDEFAAHIGTGVILFGVRATSAGQKKSCTHIPLQHRPHRVYTREFSF